jgi:transcription elongation factor Elf1
MTQQSIAPLAFEFRRYMSGPSCPRCGDSLLAADSSHFVSEGRVRHDWTCDSCGAKFHTAVAMAAPEDARRPA